MSARLTIHDLFAAVLPPAAGVTLSQLNQLASLASLALGAAYLLWKWRREARTPPTP